MTHLPSSGLQISYIEQMQENRMFRFHTRGLRILRVLGGLKEQVQQSVNFSEHANHETGHSRLRNIVTTWRLNEPSLPD